MKKFNNQKEPFFHKERILKKKFFIIKMKIEKLNVYINKLYKEKDLLTKELYIEKTELKDFIPVIDDDVARFINIIINLFQPKKILEIGTSIGYSTTSMAFNVRKYGGKIITIEYDEKVAKQAKRNFKRANLLDVIQLIIDDALEVIPNLNEEFDLIFLDVDKQLYPKLFDDCVNILKKGGILIAEDTLFPVIDLNPKWHYLIPSIEEFNKLVSSCPKLYSTILPIGDGITFAVKI
ncbi:MAG: O-methyltransferase [Candidatus Hermodarchaeota archaeon]